LLVPGSLVVFGLVPSTLSTISAARQSHAHTSSPTMLLHASLPVTGWPAQLLIALMPLSHCSCDSILPLLQQPFGVYFFTLMSTVSGSLSRVATVQPSATGCPPALAM